MYADTGLKFKADQRLPGGEIEALKIPAHLACYWLGRSELEATDQQEVEA